ncbi:hypothetical protein [Kitasatospora xanthocidica]|nr:hypothetical protein [Kitasatospora xanthocidica]
MFRLLKTIAAGAGDVEDFRPAIIVFWSALDDFARAGGQTLNS